MQESLQSEPFRPRPPVACEPMFGPRRKLTDRLLDAVDLALDFATLGEYGLEPIAEADPVECRVGRGRPPAGRLPGHSPRSPALVAARR